MALSVLHKWAEAVRRRRTRQAEERKWLAEHEYPSRLDCYDWFPEQRPKP
jgi:hypothetical protein